MRKVTIEDISKLTGLSRGTVSRALNNRPDISTKTKTLVLDACTKLEYVPSVAARSLATGRHYTLALVVADSIHYGIAAFVSGVVAAADARNFSVQLVELPDEPAARRSRVHRLVADRIDGVVLFGGLGRALIPVMQASVFERSLVSTEPLPGLACDILAIDHEAAGRLAATHVAGRRGKALFLQRASDPTAAARQAGFAAALAAGGGLSCESLLIGGEDALEKLPAGIAAATVIAGSDDALALAAALRCASDGRRIGREVAILGFGGDPMTDVASPSITTVDLRWRSAGERAVEAMIHRAEADEPIPPIRIPVEPVLVPRESTLIS